jgi:hypothetical protein
MSCLRTGAYRSGATDDEGALAWKHGEQGIVSGIRYSMSLQIVQIVLNNSIVVRCVRWDSMYNKGTLHVVNNIGRMVNVTYARRRSCLQIRLHSRWDLMRLS